LRPDNAGTVRARAPAVANGPVCNGLANNFPALLLIKNRRTASSL
jgi:hypothetical protein